jgi:hypothetical protein
MINSVIQSVNINNAIFAYSMVIRRDIEVRKSKLHIYYGKHIIELFHRVKVILEILSASSSCMMKIVLIVSIMICAASCASSINQTLENSWMLFKNVYKKQYATPEQEYIR